MKSPGRMVCHGCNDDIGPTRFDDDVRAWVYECPSCVSVDGPLTIEITEGAGSGKKSLRDGSGIMAELGIYDGLKEAISLESDRWLEFGVVEHLYATIEHEAFRRLVDDYGHVAIHPDTNTASWMLGGRCGRSSERANSRSRDTPGLAAGTISRRGTPGLWCHRLPNPPS